MKKVLGLICILGLLFIGYQWVTDTAYWQEEIKPTVNETVQDIKNSSVISTLVNDISKDSEDEKQERHTFEKHDEIIAALSQHFINRDSSFTITIDGKRADISEQLTEWMDEAASKDDYTRYVLESYSYTLTSWSSHSTVSVEARYRETLAMTEQVRANVQSILQQLDIENKSVHDQIKLIHDFIVRHIQYDESLTKYTAYEALFEQQAVCQGYALLGYMMYSEAGIPVRIAEGTVQSGEHAWVMLQVEGQWFHLDLTWDDPIGQSEDHVSYKYYLVSDAKLREDHSWVRTYPTAALSYEDLLQQQLKQAADEDSRSQIMAIRASLDLHWNDEEYTVASKEQLHSVIRGATKQREPELKFRYVDGSYLLDDLKNAFKAVNIALSYQVSYSQWSADGDVLVTIQIEYNS